MKVRPNIKKAKLPCALVLAMMGSPAVMAVGVANSFNSSTATFLPEMGQVVVVAQAPRDSSSRSRDWIDAVNYSGNPNFRVQFERQIENERKVPQSTHLTQQGFTYNEIGPLGIPSLGFSYGVEGYAVMDGRSYSLMPQALSLAVAACERLDLRALQAGSFGPECKVTQILKAPKGKLEPLNDPNLSLYDFRYTPPRVGTETVRFILENGAGKKIDVTVKMVTRMESVGSVDAPADFSERELPPALNQWFVAAELSRILGSARSRLIGFSDIPGRNGARLETVQTT